MNTEVWYRHRLTCGCEFVTGRALAYTDLYCHRHEAQQLVVSTVTHTWRGMRRVDLVEERNDDA